MGSEINRELLLLRHGKSDWDVPCSDFNRPLKGRGKRGAEKIAQWLEKNQLLPDFIVSSPAQRALQTAEIVTETLGRNLSSIQQDSRIYAAGIHDLMKVLLDCPDQAQRVLLVGHNPGLEALLIYLLADYPEIPEDNKLLPTATLARLRILNNWNQTQKSCAELLSIKRPTGM